MRLVSNSSDLKYYLYLASFLPTVNAKYPPVNQKPTNPAKRAAPTNQQDNQNTLIATTEPWTSIAMEEATPNTNKPTIVANTRKLVTGTRDNTPKDTANAYHY